MECQEIFNSEMSKEVRSMNVHFHEQTQDKLHDGTINADINVSLKLIIQLFIPKYVVYWTVPICF